jgi:hypothetical protein
MRKKWAALFLASVMCMSGSAIYANAKTSADFTDLKDLDAATKVKFDSMISAGIFDGVSDTEFGLNDKMNRAQFAKVAALIFSLDVDKSATTSSFSDVSADDSANGYALPYIEAIKAAGITDGYSPGEYNPAGDVTKEQLAAFLVRGLGMEKDAQASPGVRDNTVSDWAKGYVALALEKKIMTSGSDGQFGGTNDALRIDLITVSYNSYEEHQLNVAGKPTATPTATPTSTPMPTPTPTPEESSDQTPTPTQAPTPEPTQAPTPTPTPTQAPTPEPTQAPTPEPTQAPTPEPTQAPTPEPTQAPTPEPTQAPTPTPTQAPMTEQEALETIKEYFYMPYQQPDVTTFATAGIGGVTVENIERVLDAIGVAHRDYQPLPDTTPFNFTKEEIQGIVDTITD